MPGPDDRTSPAGASSSPADPFHGGGEAGAILRSIDWSQRAIGPVEHWPQSLRTALGICLASRHPICIIWGPQRLYFYNDAYAPMVGAKHPWALGESYIAVWPEIWESVIRPILERVEATGEASWADNLLLVLRRHGYNEECYFAFSFAPTRIENGSVGGVFTAITETTQQVVSERRLRTLRDLGVRAHEAKTAEDACRIASEVLSANRFDVPFALFYLIDSTRRTARLVDRTGIDPGGAAAPQQVALDGDEASDAWGFREVMASGAAITRTQLGARLGRLPGGPWPESAHSAAVLPIARPGEEVPYGFLVCGASPRRPFDADCQNFFGLVGSHVSTAVANAWAYAEERRRVQVLAELDRAKTDFFSNVSHEFRTPLTLMLGPLEELLAGTAGAELPPDTRRQLEMAHRNSQRLLRLVNSLLDFSRLEAGRMQGRYAPVDLAAVTTELAAMFRAAMEKAGLALIVACEPAPEPAYVDRDMWEKIVFNLLSNAYKFTEQGEVIVQLRMTNAAFVLSVRDTGAGIAPEHQADVFKRFHRAQSSYRRTQEGAGIGLALVHELTRLHGGTVELESAPGQGSTFTVRIPRGRAHLPAERIGETSEPAPALALAAAPFEAAPVHGRPTAGDAAAAGPAGSARRVLVADDNADMRDYVQRLLKDDYDVRLAEDGQAALAIAREWQPHLVLADVMMPRLDGVSLIAALRADPVTKAVPAILLSARAGEEARIAGLAAGADDYLTKPFSARELLARVRSHVHLAEMRHEAEAQVTATEARFEQLVAMMPAGVIACGIDGRVIYFNRRAAEVWGDEPRPGDSYATFASRFKVLRPDGTPMPVEERQMAVALREGRSFRNVEGLMERPDGTRFLASFSISPTYDRAGRINGVINVFQDVTAEREARAALRETEERYRAVFQQATVGIFECELDGKIVRTNPALTRIVGFTAEELQTKNWRDLGHPDELAADEALAARLLKQEDDSIRAERRYRRKDGTFGWVDVFATLIKNAAGRAAYGLAVVVDISERKRAEAELSETEGRFRIAADNAPVLIWIADTEKRCTWFNKPWLEFVGRTLEQDAGFGWVAHVHPADHDRCLRTYTTSFDARQAFSMEYRLRRHDGEYRWVLDHGLPRYSGSEFVGYIGSCIDITDRKQAEEAMHASRNAESARRQELEVITQVAPAGIWMAHDPECRLVTGNEAAHRMMRVPGGENLSRQPNGPPEARRVEICRDGQRLAEEDLPLRVAIRTGEPLWNQEFEFRFPDGASTWVYGSATPLFDERGAVRGAVCILVDITERRETEAALRKSEEQLRLVTDHASVLIAQVDREHRYRFVNRAYAERYGREPYEFRGRLLSEMIGPDGYAAALPQMQRTLAGSRVEFELEVPMPGVGKRWQHIVLAPERDAAGAVTGFVAVLVDITARKRAEQELERARDDALAASRAKDDFLAALSHELRTPLSPVLLLASEAAEDMALPDEARRSFDTIRKSVELEARLIDDLLDLTRITRGKLALEECEVNLAAVLRDAFTTVAAEFQAKQIDVRVAVTDEPTVVWGDAVRLQQVFWNILKNAVKFTPETGRVRVSCRVDRERSVAVVEVADSGIGITPQELQRVFDAFAQGDHAGAGGSHRFGGLGLGLAISRRVVELHRGRVEAESRGRDHGALFRVELPLHVTAKAAVPAPVGIPARVAGEPAGVAPTRERKSGRILLVEDHAATRAALEHLLARRDYAVRSAGSAADARELARGESFDFVISDIGLPDGSGNDLMRELRALYGLRGIALTGYGREDDVSRSEEAGFVIHLTKPVRMQSLEQALAAVRDRARPA